MDRVAVTLDPPIGVEELLSLICVAAVDTVRGAEYAGITLADRDGNLSTPAATDPLVQRVDALQYVLMEGPCIDAVHGDWESDALDLGVEGRWPRYSPRATGTGNPLPDRHSAFRRTGPCVASLNLYSSRPQAFDDDTLHAAHLFAIHAAHALGRAMTKTEFHDALVRSRGDRSGNRHCHAAIHAEFEHRHSSSSPASPRKPASNSARWPCNRGKRQPGGAR